MKTHMNENMQAARFVNSATASQLEIDIRAVADAMQKFNRTLHLSKLADYFYYIAKKKVAGKTADEVRQYILFDATPESGMDELNHNYEIEAVGALFMNDIFDEFHARRRRVIQENNGNRAADVGFMVHAAWEMMILGNSEVADRLIEELDPFH